MPGAITSHVDRRELARVDESFAQGRVSRLRRLSSSAKQMAAASPASSRRRSSTNSADGTAAFTSTDRENVLRRQPDIDRAVTCFQFCDHLRWHDQFADQVTKDRK